jgi:hypothetical protein
LLRTVSALHYFVLTFSGPIKPCRWREYSNTERARETDSEEVNIHVPRRSQEFELRYKLLVQLPGFARVRPPTQKPKTHPHQTQTQPTLMPAKEKNKKNPKNIKKIFQKKNPKTSFEKMGPSHRCADSRSV